MKFFFDRSGLLNAALAQLQAGLDKLNFKDNFQGFEYSGIIPTSTEVSIPNKMGNDLIPTGFIITMAEGVNSIVKGDAEWSTKHVSLKNFDATTDAKVTVFFYR